MNDGRTLFLFRHCRPERDFPQRYVGSCDPGLSEEGRERAAVMFEGVPVGGLPVYTSPSRRSQQTAEIALGRPYRCDPGLSELSFGVLDGLLPEEAAALYPEAFRHLVRNPLDAAPFGGDDWRTMLARAAGFLERVAGQSIVVVGHQIALWALLRSLGDVHGRVDAPLAYGEGVVVVQDGGTQTVTPA